MSDSGVNDQILESCPACAEPLDVTDFEPFTKVICPKCSHETRVKRQLGKYFLERRHAVGGMSVVYVAQDTTLDRKVAVKILNETYSSDETRVAAFESEARLTAAVNHPNVVRIFTVGRNFDRFYLVMEMIEGQNFEIMMSKRGALPEDEVLDIALQVADGLRAANQAGVLHRDVKPGNILFTKDGRAKLVDFGLALITQGGSAQAEEIWATPYYVPPEALEKGEEDFRSDLYAFGATLYHALYGKPPFESTSNGTKVLKRAKQTIPRLKKVAPWLGNSTCEAIDRMMAYQPKHRWESYDDVVSILKKARQEAEYSDGKIIHSSSRARRRGKKSPLFYPSIIAAVLAVGLFIFQFLPNTNSNELPVKPPEAKPTETKAGEEKFSREKRNAEAWSTAHTAVKSSNYTLAYNQLIALSENQDQDQSNRVFARVVGLINLYLDGQSISAQNEIIELQQQVSDLPKKSPARRKLIRLSEALSDEQPIKVTYFTDSPQRIADWTSLLTIGLKLWDQGRPSQANEIFSQVRGAAIHEDHPWFAIYQEKLADYQADASLLADLSNLDRPTDLEETETLITRLEETASKLKTKGRAHYTLESRLVYYTRLHKGYQLRPYAQPGLSWQELVQLMETSAGSCNFKKARGLLSNEVASTHLEAKAAWIYLLDQATLFLHDFNEKENWIVVHKNGSSVTVTQSDQDGIVSAKKKRVAWQNLTPDSLLTAHEGLQDDQIQEHAIAFAWLTGLTDEAEAMADGLAGANENFAAKWREVVIGLSQ